MCRTFGRCWEFIGDSILKGHFLNASQSNMNSRFTSEGQGGGAMKVVMEMKAEMDVETEMEMEVGMKTAIEMEMEMQGRCVLPKTVKEEGPVVNGSLLSTPGPKMNFLQYKWQTSLGWRKCR